MIDNHLVGAELIAAVHQIDLGGEPRKITSLFHSRIAAADDGNFQLLEERRIAYGAVGNAHARVRAFAGAALLAEAGPAGHDDRSGGDFGTVFERDDLLAVANFQFLHGSGAEFGLEMLGMGAEGVRQPGARAIQYAGIVFNLARDQNLPAGASLFQYEGIESGALAVDGGGKSSGPRADDDQFTFFHSTVPFAAVCRQWRCGECVWGCRNDAPASVPCP